MKRTKSAVKKNSVSYQLTMNGTCIVVRVNKSNIVIDSSPMSADVIGRKLDRLIKYYIKRFGKKFRCKKIS